MKFRSADLQDAYETLKALKGLITRAEYKAEFEKLVAKQKKRDARRKKEQERKKKKEEEEKSLVEQVKESLRSQIDNIKAVRASPTTERFGIIFSHHFSFEQPIELYNDMDLAQEQIDKIVDEMYIAFQTIDFKGNRFLVKLELGGGSQMDEDGNKTYDDSQTSWRTLGSALKIPISESRFKDVLGSKVDEWGKIALQYEAYLIILGFEFIDLPDKKDLKDAKNLRKYNRKNKKPTITQTQFLDIIEPGGGCDGRSHTKIVNGMKIHSPKSAGNNCLFACIHRHLNIFSADKYVYNHKREELGIEKGTLIYMSQLEDIACHYDISLYLYDYNGNFVEVFNEDADNICNIMLYNDDGIKGHYVLVEDIQFKCDECGKSWLNNHKCNFDTKMYFNRLKGNRQVIPARINKKEAFDSGSMIFYDLETFKPDNTDSITPYACGYFMNGIYNQHYGPDAWTEFFTTLIQQEDKILCAYNGAGFDFHFLMNELIARGIKIDNTIMNNGRLLSFTFGRNIRCWDLCLFTLCPLKDACKDFKVSEENTKSEFNHELIHSWADVEKYRSEVEPYLKKDVMGMKEVFEKFNDMVYEIFNTHITSFITLSGMSYALWTQSLKKNEIRVELPDAEKYDYIRSSLYGGRTYPMCREYTSKYYEQIMESEVDELKELYKTIDDWIFNADATSLYPTAMVNYKYPTGSGRWLTESEIQEIDFNNLKTGIYTVSIKCNKDLIVPILPYKSPNGGLYWNLIDRTATYTSADLENALRFGYTIEKIHKALVYDETADVFTDYIMKCFKIKTDNEDNPVKRQIGKILMNALYGKMLEKARFDEGRICNNVDDYYDFIESFTTTDVMFLNDKIYIVGEPLNEMIKDKRIRKPSQIGTFILAYSRRHMLDLMSAMCPKLDEHFFTYTDTDSLHIKNYLLPGLEEKGLLKKGLGMLSDDAKGGKIFKEINLAPKLYMYLCLMPNGEIKTVMKSKGIPTNYLTEKLFIEADELDDEDKCIMMTSRLKKIGLGRNLQLDWRKYDAFNILSIDMERTFYKTKWEGMDLKDNLWFPKK